MIDEKLLTDPTRCPSCTARLATERPRCSACGIALRGELPDRLWQASVTAARALEVRAEILTVLRAGAADGRAAAAPVAAASETVEPVAVTPLAPAPAVPLPTWAPRPDPTPRVPRDPGATRRLVRTVLLSLGVLLLAVAATIFLVVAWSLIGVGGRAAVLTALTGAALGGAVVVHRRGLAATAEALGVLGVLLLLLDLLGVRLTDLFGAAGVDPAVYLAASSAALAGGCAALARTVPLRAWSVAAAAAVQLPVPVLAARLASGAAHPVLVLALGAVLQIAVLAAVLVLARVAGRGRLVLVVGLVAAFVAAVTLSVATAVDAGLPSVVGSSLLLPLALVATLSRRVERRTAPVAAATAAVLVATSVTLPALLAVPVVWLGSVLGGAAVLAAAAAVAARGRSADWRRGSLLPAAGAFVPAVALEVGPLLDVLSGGIAWAGRPWSGSATTSAADAVALPDAASFAGPHLLGGLLVATAAVVVRRAVAGGDRQADVPLVVALGALLGATVLPTLGAPLWAALAGELTLAAAAGAVALVVPGRRVQVLATVGVLLVHAVGWSLATPALTLAAWSAVLAAALLPVRLRWDGPAALVPLIAVPVALMVQTAATSALLGAGVRTGGASVAVAAALAVIGAGLVRRPWAGAHPATLVTCATGWAVGTAVVACSVPVSQALVVASAAGLVGALTTALLRRDDPAAPSWAVAALGVLLTTTTVAARAGLSPAANGLVVVAAVALLTLVAARWPGAGGQGTPVEAALAVGASAGLLVLASAPSLLWIALLLVGAALAVHALALGRRSEGVAATALLLVSSWVRLTLADVQVPEAYTLPAAAVVLAAAAWAARHGRAPGGSWQRWGGGLGLALAPSAVLVLADGPTVGLRCVLLGAGALVALLAGARARLAAPLWLGAGALAVDAVVQLAPTLGAAYQAVPTWVLLSLAGALLLAAGAGYERAVQDLRSWQRRLAGLQ